MVLVSEAGVGKGEIEVYSFANEVRGEGFEGPKLMWVVNDKKAGSTYLEDALDHESNIKTSEKG
jgi:hypothetical protein